ncbi:Uncharacterized protein Rs2_37415 [Raphanus sativus]|nr:Uncharacterized protein Rs2_37415 [Raphanus sativus]
MSKTKRSDCLRLLSNRRELAVSALYSIHEHQKLSFQAGERHGLEKLYQWIWRQQEGGSRVTPVDIINYIQNELECCTEEPQYPQERRHLNQQCVSQIQVSLLLQTRLAQQLFQWFGLSNTKTMPRTRFSQTPFQVQYVVVCRTIKFRREATYLVEPEAVN